MSIKADALPPPQGNLALSRALGDFEFKQNALLDAQHQIVTADPDVLVHDISGEEEFIVIACDGPFFLRSLETNVITLRVMLTSALARYRYLGCTLISDCHVTCAPAYITPNSAGRHL